VILFAGMELYLMLPWWVLPVLLLIIFIQVLRARNEARVLEARFGDAYRQYRSRTWF
jgi:protein-S-isoprenylcysteine O-methyltransferase Ste14